MLSDDEIVSLALLHRARYQRGECSRPAAGDDFMRDLDERARPATEPGEIGN